MIDDDRDQIEYLRKWNEEYNRRRTELHPYEVQMIKIRKWIVVVILLGIVFALWNLK